jgi:hypothetical protein
MDESTDLRQLTFNFLTSLPVTIRDHVLLFVILFATHTKPPKNRDYAEVLRDYLFNTNDMTSFGILLCVIAVIDHVLADSVANRERRATTIARAAETDSRLEKAILQLPLRARHFEKALADWTSLRSSALTPERLRDFEDRLMGIPPTK